MTSAVRLVLQSQQVEDAGVGIVISRRPLLLLVPDHLLVLLEEGVGVDAVLVDGEECIGVRRLHAPALAKDHLALLQVTGKRLKGLAPVRLPRSQVALNTGRPIRIVGPKSASSPGTIDEILVRGEQASIVTDVDVSPGDSGSALMAGDELIGICQGRTRTGEGSRAVAVPLGQAALRNLRRLRNRRRVGMLTVLASLLLAAALALAAVAVRSSISFDLAGLDVDNEGATITAHNGQALTFRSTWMQTFETPIFSSATISEASGAKPTMIGVGTVPEDTIDGAFILIDQLGRELWRYSIPQGECIYADEGEVYDLFLVTHIVSHDLDLDGTHELLVVFVHDHFYPCKLVVFELTGEILAEYWHPGYFRTIAVGAVGDPDSEPMIVVSASNNRIKTSWWNPQTLFAFEGLEIAGQAPPYTGVQGRPEDLEAGSELWYRVIENIDGETLRAKCRRISIGDYNGDGRNEIRAATTDGRFYYINELGETVWIDLGDNWFRDFGDTPAPDLTVLPLDLE